MSTQTTIARGDLRAYEESVRLAAPELVERLRDLLGAKLVAYLGSVQETRAVRQWADPNDPRTPASRSRAFGSPILRPAPAARSEPMTLTPPTLDANPLGEPL